MCFVLYAGTSSPLARRKWERDAPDLSVQSLCERDAPIKAHFTRPEVQYVGSTSGCGCDFPHAILQNFAWPEIGCVEHLKVDPERAATDRYNKEALINLLRTSGENAIELYGVWDGDFAEPPEVKEVITAETILDPRFRFRERAFYEVSI